MQLEIRKLCSLLGISILISSCSYKNKSDLKFEEVFSRSVEDKVYYNLINEKIFQPKCVSCHGDSGNISLETYADIYGHIEKIKEVTITTKKMPKSPYQALTNSELGLLATWIKAGAPEKPLDGTEQPPVKIEPLEPTFNSINKNILKNKCIVCHSVGKVAERVPLDSPKSMIDSPLEIVIPGNSEESGLIISTSPNARKIMPPKKSGIAPLKPEEIEIVRQWIDNGAKD